MFNICLKKFIQWVGNSIKQLQVEWQQTGATAAVVQTASIIPFNTNTRLCNLAWGFVQPRCCIYNAEALQGLHYVMPKKTIHTYNTLRLQMIVEHYFLTA